MALPRLVPPFSPEAYERTLQKIDDAEIPDDVLETVDELRGEIRETTTPD